MICKTNVLTLSWSRGFDSVMLLSQYPSRRLLFNGRFPGESVLGPVFPWPIKLTVIFDYVISD